MARDDAFYINLDRVPERRAFIEARFAAIKCDPPRRWSATDGADPSAIADTGYRKGTGRTWELVPSEIACFESHRCIWNHAVEAGLDSVLIFEDDVTVAGNIMDIVDDLRQAAEAFDIVKIDYSPKRLRFGPEQRLNGHVVREIREVATSAGGYLLSREGCRKLLAWSETYSDHLDDFIFTPRTDWRMVQLFPAIALQMVLIAERSGAGLSDTITESERTKDASTNRRRHKTPFWFKLRNELRNGRKKLAERTGGDRRLLEAGGFIGHPPCASDLKRPKDETTQ